MAKIVIYSSGTLGDHLPVIALAQALGARGHRARMVINPAMVPYARRAGIETVELLEPALGPEEARQDAWAWNHWHFPDPFAHPGAPAFDRDAFFSQIKSLTEACRDADLLLATAIRIQGYLVAQILAIPWLTISMNPYAFWEPTTAIQCESLRHMRLKESELFTMIAREVFAQFGTAWVPPSYLPGWHYARHVLLASSPYFFAPNVNQLQPHASVDLTGFWFYQDPDWENWQPDDELRQFCEPDDPARRPIALTFSSQPLEDAGKILQNHVAAAARVDRPLLVLSGWAGFSERDLPPGTEARSVKFAGFIPHDWVFRRAACTIQHGGIGSIARALRQGCPLLIEPFGNDQVFNACQVAYLGAGITVPPFQTTVTGLVDALRQLLINPNFRYQARALGARMASENGTGAACEMIERYLGRLGPDRSLPGFYDRFSPPLTPRQKEVVHAGSPLEFIAQGSVPELKSKTGTTMIQEIPPVIHVLWKDRNLPRDLAAYLSTWITHHPNWTCLLWTDEDCREFLRRHYSWFLSIYEGYPEPIKRVDAVRYFILNHCGGLYVDMDFECFRSIHPLLAGKQLVFGLEPAGHLDAPIARQRNLDRIIGNALMASVPGHPFWEHVFKQLVANHKLQGPLDATGPFMLTRAITSYPHPEQIRLEKAEAIYPIHNEQIWLELDEAERQSIARSSFAVHHWRGGWWRPSVMEKADQIKVTLLSHGARVYVAALELDHAVLSLTHRGEIPLVSCLMVTGGSQFYSRLPLTQRAIQLFLAQTYPAKELVIVDDGVDQSLEKWLYSECGDSLARGDIVYVRLPPEGRSLGSLRNAAVGRSRGTYVAQWDDDDLSHPQRLTVQMAVLGAFQVQVCTLERQQLWWPDDHRLAVSNRRVWEGSFLCDITQLPQYPNQAKGEDTPVIEQLLQKGRMVLIDMPQLYTYVFHGGNTFDKAHWETHWREATESYEGEVYQVKLAEMQQQLSVDLTVPMDTLRSPTTPKQPPMPPDTFGEEGEGAMATLVDAPIRSSLPGETRLQISDANQGKPNSEQVLLLIPTKNVQPWLPTLWTNLHALSYPRECLSVAFLESDSVDGTYELLQQQLPSLRQIFQRADLFKRDFHYQSSQPRWLQGEQYRRRSVLARSRNHLLVSALKNENWVLWIDADVARWPADIIQQLLATGKDIVVPNCLTLGSRRTFDYNTFKLHPDADRIDWTPYLVDGILQPPKGLGRLYLSDLQEHDCVEVDAVGATMLLVRADLHREGLVFPPFSYKMHIESEGLAFMARDMGYRCWGLPNLEIFHPPI
jgi:mannosyltransferase OCH1-like enzyme/UDP:flavonoid glycosyltransferase YjiC (YdhE family)/GT2 family glycosyltransferase